MTELETMLLAIVKRYRYETPIGNQPHMICHVADEAIAAAEAAQPDEVQRAVEAEREARKAAQLETITIREELTKRAMLAESEAYQRGVRDEREACAKVCERQADEYGGQDWYLSGCMDSATAIRARGNKH